MSHVRVQGANGRCLLWAPFIKRASREPAALLGHNFPCQRARVSEESGPRQSDGVEEDERGSESRGGGREHSVTIVCPRPDLRRVASDGDREVRRSDVRKRHGGRRRARSPVRRNRRPLDFQPRPRPRYYLTSSH